MNSDILISVIILTYNEEINLPDCLLSLHGLNANIFIVDSGSTDNTLNIAKQNHCHVTYHPFLNYAAQRNWAFDHLCIQTKWTLCLDADERLTEELVNEINSIIYKNDNEINGYLLCKRTVFMKKWIKYGGQYPSYHLRLFRTGKGRCESREYDQHFVVKGKIGRLKNDYMDVIGTDLSTWTLRHVRWADMEIKEVFQKNMENQIKPFIFGNPIERKRFFRTYLYEKTPLFLRAFLFWFYVYFIRFGFLDGRSGLIFHTLRCFWFRFLVDAKFYEKKVF
jgi:glycosyltransferase involved in cell wall biosynthesis